MYSSSAYSMKSMLNKKGCVYVPRSASAVFEKATVIIGAFIVRRTFVN
jgi:hypothetical protein